MNTPFTITGTSLPGKDVVLRNGDRHTNVHIGIQRRKEVIDVQPADAKEVIFRFDVDVDNGDFNGPYVQGRPGERFVYLSWGEFVKDEFRMFGRIKLFLAESGANHGKPVHGLLVLTDIRGGPLFASVRPPKVTWSALDS